jgi:PAS domain S-box-containing protein
MQKTDISKPKVTKKKADDAAILVLHKKSGKIIDANIAAKKLFKKNISDLKKCKLMLLDAKKNVPDIESRLSAQNIEEQFIIDAIPAWIFYKDKKNNFIKVNESFCRGLGKTKKELEGKSLLELFPKEIADKYYKDDLEVIESGKSKLGIVESVPSPNGELWLKTDKILYTDEKKNIAGIIGFSVDVTDQKKYEQQLNDKILEQEKLNKLMIGRELKMVELKREIVDLKTKHTQVSKASDVRFQEGVELEENIVESLDHDYMLMVMDSSLSRHIKNVIVGYLEVLLLDSRRHEKALEDLS